MRVLEMLWVAACVAMLIILLSRNTINRKAGAIVCIAGGLLFAVQLLVEGYRWQMIPAYIVTALLFVLVLFKRRTVKKPLRYTIWGLSVVLLGGSVALSALLPVFHLPKPSGEFRVGNGYAPFR